jgi:uncharacterized membrane protein YeaQ/YmgE (transglycosylase-associated protein family)
MIVLSFMLVVLLGAAVGAIGEFVVPNKMPGGMIAGCICGVIGAGIGAVGGSFYVPLQMGPSLSGVSLFPTFLGSFVLVFSRNMIPSLFRPKDGVVPAHAVKMKSTKPRKASPEAKWRQ